MHFGEGVDVSCVKLPSDAFTIRLANIPVRFSCLGLSIILQPLGVQYCGKNILIYDRTVSRALGEVQLDDCYIAEFILYSLHKKYLGNHKISAQFLRNEIVPDTAQVGYRLPLSLVPCTSLPE